MITQSKQRAEITQAIESIREAAEDIQYAGRVHETRRGLDWVAKAQQEYRNASGLWHSLLILVRATISDLPDGTRAWVEAEAKHADKKRRECRAKLAELDTLYCD